MYSTYEQLVAYFRALPTVVSDLKGATVGHDEDIEGLQNTRILYPHLWVETPEVKFVGTDYNPATRYYFSISVITNEPLQKPEEGNAKLSATLMVMQSVWARMLEDADEELFDLVLQDGDGDPIRQWSADNAYGWRLRVAIDLPRYECAVVPYVPIETGLAEEYTHNTGGATFTYQVPAGKMLKAIYVKSSAAMTVRVGTSAGGDQLVQDVSTGAGQYALLGENFLYAETITPIYFSGLAGNSVIKIYLL
jgi:hypothetical protein